MKRQPKTLLRKLKEVAESIPYVEKRGHNDVDGYHYQKASDVARIFRAELFKRNVLLIADEKEVTEREVESMSGGRTWITTLKVEFTFHDVDTNAILTKTGFGSGADAGDKGLYKAKTGAMKYMLRGLGLIPDERDDPEFAETHNQGDEPRKPVDRSTLRIVDYQVRAFDVACHRSGKTAPQIAGYLQGKFGLSNALDLTREQFEEAMKWACGTDDLADTLETSIKAVKAIAATLEHQAGKAVNQ